MSKVLIAGATGFVGKRLIPTLLKEGHEVYAICRTEGKRIFSEEYPNLFYLWGDLRNPETFKDIPHDIDAAYYLVHSMSEIVSNLSNLEEQVAKAFIEGIKHTRVKQLIYLGGIINDEKSLSPHLTSRLLVEKILVHSKIPTTILRASLIIGAGSASFQIIRDLCEKLPLMIAPKWVNTPCQPIGIQDVLFYLTNVLHNKECNRKIFDIGGPEILTFKQLMQQYSSIRGLKTWIINVPLLSPRLSSYWLFFVTSVPFSICYYLVESMKSSTIVQFKDIQSILPHTCLTYQQSLISALQKISDNQIVPLQNVKEENPDIKEYLQLIKEKCLKDEQCILISASRETVIDRIWKIGGKNGYYAFDWAWSLRGLIDKLVGGVGLNRKRRDPADILVGDAIDFWRVLIADKKNGYLVLVSNMKIPGKAWLVFRLIENQGSISLVQTALFLPRGIFGYIYWYILYPIHCFLFYRMAIAIAKNEETA